MAHIAVQEPLQTDAEGGEAAESGGAGHGATTREGSSINYRRIFMVTRAAAAAAREEVNASLIFIFVFSHPSQASYFNKLPEFISVLPSPLLFLSPGHRINQRTTEANLLHTP